MQHLFSMIIALLVCCGIFTGCNAEKAPETIADDIFISESISAIPEDAFSFQNSDYSDIAFESYLHEHGTSSVNSSILIYRYNDTLILAVSYFNCGTSAMETFALTQEQGDALMKMVSDYKKSDNQSTAAMGGNYYEYVLNDGKKEIQIEPLALAEIGMTLKSEAELTFRETSSIIFPSAEAKNDFPVKLRVGHAYAAVYNSISEQIEEIFDSPIVSVDSMTVGDMDTLMTATLEDGSTHSFLVTDCGYVVRYK